MKTYTKPEINIVSLNNEDVITVSGGINTTKFSTNYKYTTIYY